MFVKDPELAAWAARAQCDVTGHFHPLSHACTAFLADAIVRAVQRGVAGLPYDASEFVSTWIGDAPSELAAALSWVRDNPSASPEDAKDCLGTSALVTESVPLAFWCFSSFEDDAETAVIRAVNMGGDSDTIGAMTGALAGAYSGISSWPVRWVTRLENGPKGRDYVLHLADDLLRYATRLRS
jgi:poly(ADP-ribose) glycohydrolase ARH3